MDHVVGRWADGGGGVGGGCVALSVGSVVVKVVCGVSRSRSVGLVLPGLDIQSILRLIASCVGQFFKVLQGPSRADHSQQGTTITGKVLIGSVSLQRNTGFGLRDRYEWHPFFLSCSTMLCYTTLPMLCSMVRYFAFFSIPLVSVYHVCSL